MWPPISYSENGRIRVVDALTAVFFVDVRHQDCAEAIAEAIDRVVAFAGSGAFRYFVDEEGDTRPLTSAAYRLLSAELRESAAQGEGGLRLIGDESHVTGMDVYYFGQAEPSEQNPDWRNVLGFRFSRDLFMQHGSAQFRLFMRSLAEALPFSFGYVSPRLDYWHDIRRAARIARRYPGFDILDPVVAGASIGNQMAGVYWLSFLGQALSARLGGAEHIRKLLPNIADVMAYPDGRVELLIADEPEVGDVNRNDNLPCYRAVAKVLEPHLHIPDIAYFFEDDGITSDKDAMVAWHRRYLD
jgi:hypothetical protein